MNIDRTLPSQICLVGTGQSVRAAGCLAAWPMVYRCSASVMARYGSDCLHCAMVWQANLRAGGNRGHGRRRAPLARVAGGRLRRLSR
jgi:hypothetical protein